jgi:hypothetical protein
MVFFNTKIEGNDVIDFGWGAAGAKPIVLRFDVYASVISGNYTVAVRNGATNRSWLGSFAATAGAWKTITLVIPGDTTGTWATDNTTGLDIGFTFATGSTYGSGVPGWQAGNFIGITGMTNGSAQAQNIYIANVGVYLDPDGTGIAPPWQTPNYADELARCQRYWETGNSYMDGYGVAGTFLSETIQLITKRAGPTVSATAGALSNMTGNWSDYPTPTAMRHYRQIVATGNCAWNTVWTASARM